MTAILGDCVDVLPELQERAHLIYVDPPFFTQQVWKGTAGEFDDRFDDLGAYCEWMYPRLLAMRHSLVPGGVLAVHADDHAWHYLAIMLDFIFEPEARMATVRWKRSSGQTERRGFLRTYDTIVFYVAPGPALESELWDSLHPDDWILASGHPSFDVDLVELGQRVCDPLWKVAEFDPDAVPVSYEPRVFHHHCEGDPCSCSDLWLDIPPAGKSERTGYPTQKPEALLERIVTTLTDPGDLVIDPMCGSGTTLAVAQRLGRRFFGCDVNDDAVAIARGRTDRPLQQNLLGVAS